MHLTSSPLDWYVARAGGVVAYVLLSANVAVGLTMTAKKSMRRWPKFAMEDVHRFGGILVGTFVVIHIVSVAIDSYLPFSILSLIVPFASHYRPVWTSLGVVAAELLLALAVTNHYRNRRISYSFWRKAHYVNFAVWGAATLHGLGSGTDRSTPWLLSIYVVAVGTVSALTVWRILKARNASTNAIRLAPVVAAGLAVVLVVALAAGPLRYRPKTWNAAQFHDQLSGKILSDTGATRGIISMAGNGSGAQPILVRADLLITPQAVTDTAFQMEYLPSGTVCRGTVTAVRSTGFEATCHLPGGTARFVHAEWQQGGLPGVRGVITAHS
jgi:methionine sulfoxide reductase heme-binding subunit